jgi:VWFA-related protein
MRISIFSSLLLAASVLYASDDAPAVFKSDVALTRVDAQVLDQSGRAVTGLRVQDFVLRVNGRPVPIRNFASENMPLDLVLLLDVSGSMEPHVQRLAAASEQALNVLAPGDRVAVMVFDTSTRVRLPFRSSHSEITSELNHLLRSESFSRGTRITSAMLDAARYVQREGRPEARRAIVILTDDETQDAEDEARVESALARANAILSFLQAPYEQPSLTRGGGPRRGGTRGGGTWGGGGGWPGGGGIGFPGGGIGFPGGGVGRGPGGYGDRSHTAGTAEIARESGGDTMQITEASALEDTLARLRQRYALHFYIPESSKPADQQRVQVNLSPEAGLRYRDAEIHYRQIHLAAGSGGQAEQSGPVSVARVDTSGARASEPAAQPDQVETTTPNRRRSAVNEDSESHINMIPDDPAPAKSAPSQTTPAKNQPPANPPASPPTGGWPRANPQTTPPN